MFLARGPGIRGEEESEFFQLHAGTTTVAFRAEMR